MIKGFIFDMDGTLVDNLDYHFIAFDKFIKQHNFTLIEPFDLRLNGLRGDEIFRRILEPSILERYTTDELTDMKEATYREVYSGHVKPIEGLMNLLQEAHARGIRCAIGSSGCRENVDFIIRESGIEEFINASVGGEEARRGKPAPDIFLQCAEKMGLKPEECIVFEDALMGIQAGLAAGMKTVAITTTTSADALREAGAHYIIDNYCGVTVDSLANKLGL